MTPGLTSRSGFIPTMFDEKQRFDFEVVGIYPDDVRRKTAV
jgi:hypothetical protein